MIIHEVLMCHGDLHISKLNKRHIMYGNLNIQNLVDMIPQVSVLTLTCPFFTDEL